MTIYTSLLTFLLAATFFERHDLPGVDDNYDTDPPGKRAHHALVYDEANKRIILTAGSSPQNGGSSFVFYNDLWSYDKEWKNIGSAGNERSGIGLVYDSKQKRLVSFGGFAGNSSLGDLRVLDGDTWKTLTTNPEMNAAEPGFVYDAARDRFIAFGGSKSRGQVHSTTWEWDRTTWKALDVSGPEGRQAFAMVYDPKRKKTILFGGMGTTPDKTYRDTWEFDGTSWKLVDTSGPSARMSHGYAFDTKRGLFIIFGGMGPTGMLGDTWGWDGVSWKKLSEKGPASRSMGYMAYDKARDRVVLFGGRVGWPNDMNDTWEWDGKEWREVKSLSR